MERDGSGWDLGWGVWIWLLLFLEAPARGTSALPALLGSPSGRCSLWPKHKDQGGVLLGVAWAGATAFPGPFSRVGPAVLVFSMFAEMTLGSVKAPAAMTTDPFC